jgi:hypothetical protein
LGKLCRNRFFAVDALQNSLFEAKSLDLTAPRKPNVSSQVSNARTAGGFPLAIWEGTTVKDGAIAVKFKAVSGSSTGS